ncbi:MAG: hypothetical protein ACKOPT_12935 [Cyanobium sp.]
MEPALILLDTNILIDVLQGGGGRAGEGLAGELSPLAVDDAIARESVGLCQRHGLKCPTPSS